MNAQSLALRPLRESDSLEELTRLLNRAYKALADMGFRYVASWQNVEITRSRLKDGECFVGADAKGRIIATATLHPPGLKNECAYYGRPGVAWFGQFAVEPELQGTGTGSKMLRFLEERARSIGAEELALDTAEGAAHLIDFYQKRGYRIVDSSAWDETNYRSVIMAKRLHAREPSSGDSSTEGGRKP